MSSVPLSMSEKSKVAVPFASKYKLYGFCNAIAGDNVSKTVITAVVLRVLPASSVAVKVMVTGDAAASTHVNVVWFEVTAKSQLSEA